MTLMKYRKTKWMLFTGALLTLGMFAVADAAWSQPPDGSGGRRGRMGRPGGPGGSGGTMLPLRSLDLTESQRQLVRGVMEQNAEVTRTAGERVREVREALRNAETAETPDEGAIRAVAAELANAEGDAAVQRAFVRSQVWRILTPEQQEEVRVLEQEDREIARRMEQRRERGRGSGAGRGRRR